MEQQQQHTNDSLDDSDDEECYNNMKPPMTSPLGSEDASSSSPKPPRLPYFHRELDTAELELIGDITPKQISKIELESLSASLENSVGSAWNRGTTWEDKDMTSWAVPCLQGLLQPFKQTLVVASEDLTSSGISLSAPLDGGGGGAKRQLELVIEIGRAEEVEGHANISVVRGKPRFLYDVSFELSWKATLISVPVGREGKQAHVDGDGAPAGREGGGAPVGREGEGLAVNEVGGLTVKDEVGKADRTVSAGREGEVLKEEESGGEELALGIAGGGGDDVTATDDGGADGGGGGDDDAGDADIGAAGGGGDDNDTKGLAGMEADSDDDDDDEQDDEDEEEVKRRKIEEEEAAGVLEVFQGTIKLMDVDNNCQGAYDVENNWSSKRPKGKLLTRLRHEIETPHKGVLEVVKARLIEFEQQYHQKR